MSLIVNGLTISGNTATYSLPTEIGQGGYLKISGNTSTLNKNVIEGSLIAGRIMFATGAYSASGDSNLTWDGSNKTLTINSNTSLGANKVLSLNNSTPIDLFSIYDDGHITGRLIYLEKSNWGNVALGYNAGYLPTQSGMIAIGTEAALNNASGYYLIAIGQHAGNSNTSTGDYSILIGKDCGYNNAGADVVSIGQWAGYNNTKNYLIAIGNGAGYNNKGAHPILIGKGSGYSNFADYLVAIGYTAGSNNVGLYNTFIGYSSGGANTSGSSNTFIGYSAGYNLTSGGNNTAIGDHALFNSNNSAIVAIGYRAGYTIGDDSVCVGYESGFNCTSTSSAFLGESAGSGSVGNNAVALGLKAGYQSYISQSVMIGSDNTYGTGMGLYNGSSNNIGIGHRVLSQGNGIVTYSVYIGETAGYYAIGTQNIGIGYSSLNSSYLYGRIGGHNYNIAIGSSTLSSADSCTYNVAIGYNAMANGSSGSNSGMSGSYNIAIGYQAGYILATGNYNTFIGNGSGYNLTGGSSNVFLGYQAGYNELGNSKLYISNSNTANPLIYGEFDNNVLRFNANTSINGNLFITGSINGLTIKGSNTFGSNVLKIYDGLNNPLLQLTESGILTLNKLSGSSNRAVEADSTGTFSASKEFIEWIVDVSSGDSQNRNLVSDTWVGNTFDRDGIEGQWGISGNYEYRCVNSMGLWTRYPANKEYQDVFITDGDVINSLTNENNWDFQNNYLETSATTLAKIYNGQWFISVFYDYKYFVYDIDNKKILREKINEIIYKPITGITSDTSLGILIPSGYRVNSIIAQETSGVTGVSFSIGTGSTSSEICSGTVNAASFADFAISQSFFSKYFNTELFISSGDWGSAKVNIYIKTERAL